MAELLGLDDALEGWVDVRLGALPLNEWVAAWIDLADAKHFKETITGRLENPAPDASATAGRILVKMFLSCSHRHQELCAMCLPLPDLGHSCHLDLADLVHDVVSLSKASDKLDIDWNWILHHATPIFTIIMLMTWYPPSILPVLTIIYPQILIYVSSKFSEESAPVPIGLGSGLRVDDNASRRPSLARRPSLVSQLSDKFTGNGSKELTVSRRNSTTSLADQRTNSNGTKSAPLLPDGTVVVKAEKETEQKKKGDDVEATLKNLVRLMPKHAAKDLRKSAADVNNLVQLVELIETLSAYREGFGTPFLVWTSLALTIPTAFALWWYQEYQVIVVQIAVTAVVGFYLWQYSFPGRMLTGFAYFFLTHWRIHAKAKHDSKVDPSTINVRTLARPHVKHLKLTSRGKLHDDVLHLHGHAFKLTTFRKPTWCGDCGTLLKGMKDQGFKCQTCSCTRCHNCALSEDSNSDECPGSCSIHQFEPKTFTYSAWCSQCEGFLWGMHEQGLSCRKCRVIVCHECGKQPASAA